MRYLGWALLGVAVVATDAAAQDEKKPGGPSGERVGQSGWVNPLRNRYITGKPLEVCDQGAFFVGGVPKVTEYAASGDSAGPPQQITIGQSYVQFMIPKHRRQWPLVMIHGSTHTGAALDATPDGRQGWFSYAVRKGLATFVMDQPGRGRSGWDQSVIHEAKATGDMSLIRQHRPDHRQRRVDHLVRPRHPTASSILDGTMIRHGDPGDPDPPEDFANPSPAHGNYPPAIPFRRCPTRSTR